MVKSAPLTEPGKDFFREDAETEQGNYLIGYS